MRLKIRNELVEGVPVRVFDQRNERFVVTRKDGGLVAHKLVTFHLAAGKEVKFDVRQESDGTQRLMDILPSFFDLSALGSKKVYIIDDVDRSLDASLVKSLLEGYLRTCSSGSRAQLLFTTHNSLLMDQEMLRKDEMWLAERSAEGASRLVAISDFKDARGDKDIRKSYLQGRLGGGAGFG